MDKDLGSVSKTQELMSIRSSWSIKTLPLNKAVNSNSVYSRKIDLSWNTKYHMEMQAVEMASFMKWAVC